MPKPLWHVHHLAILGRKRFAEPLAECGGIGPQVENAIPQSAANTSNDFCLGVRRNLIMHAAQRALVDTQRVIHLHKRRSQAGLLKLIAAECAREEPAIIAPLL